MAAAWRCPEGPQPWLKSPSLGSGVSRGMLDQFECRPPRIHIIRHERLPQTGSFEVQFADNRPSKFFYFDDLPGRRLRPDILTCEQALEQAKAFGRAERDKGNAALRNDPT